MDLPGEPNAESGAFPMGSTGAFRASFCRTSDPAFGGSSGRGRANLLAVQRGDSYPSTVETEGRVRARRLRELLYIAGSVAETWNSVASGAAAIASGSSDMTFATSGNDS